MSPRKASTRASLTSPSSRLRTRRSSHAWWRTYPDANIGLILGVESGIWALDTDPRNRWRLGARRTAEKQGQSPDGAGVSTGGGGSRNISAGRLTSQFRTMLELEPGLEVVGQGHVLVAPPSLHKSGQQYEWDELTDRARLPNPSTRRPGYLISSVPGCRMSTVPAAAAAKTGDRGGWPEAGSRQNFAGVRAGCAIAQTMQRNSASRNGMRSSRLLAAVGMPLDSPARVEQSSSPVQCCGDGRESFSTQRAMRGR